MQTVNEGDTDNEDDTVTRMTKKLKILSRKDDGYWIPYY